MAKLNTKINTLPEWNIMVKENRRRAEVDRDEVVRVIELARRTPGLTQHEKGLNKVAVFFARLTKQLQKESPEQLPELIDLWNIYREVIVQRNVGTAPVELRATDKIVANIFDRLIAQVPPENLAYDPNVRPLVFGGAGGTGAYATFPPTLERPLAIIRLPQSAFDNVWQWLALPHEIGHDFFASVTGLKDELESVLEQKMQAAVLSGDIKIKDVDVDLTPFGLPHKIKYSGDKLLGKIWRSWANEAQADIVGMLTCGGGTIVSLQQIIGFSTSAPWEIQPQAGGNLVDFPEEHPVPYIRNLLNISALRKLTSDHSLVADEIEKRFDHLKPPVTKITWRIGQTITIAEIPVKEMIKSAELAAEIILHHPFAALGGKSYESLATFSTEDQIIVDALVDPLVDGDPGFTEAAKNVEPRHALAATIFAFEKKRDASETINQTFKYFV